MQIIRLSRSCRWSRISANNRLVPGILLLETSYWLQSNFGRIGDGTLFLQIPSSIFGFAIRESQAAPWSQ